jgi:hypothetical protein
LTGSLFYCFPCPGCGESIPLPRRSPLGIFYGQQFVSAIDIWPIWFLCLRAAKVREVIRSAIHLGTEAVQRHGARANSIWGIDCECTLDNCGKRHSIYTSYLRDSDPSALSRLLLDVHPMVPCLGGHPAKFHSARIKAYLLE